MSVTFCCSDGDWSPEINVSNRNARLLLTALGLDFPELYGEISDLHGAIRATVLALNTTVPADLAVAPSETVGARGCRIIDAGASAVYLRQRLVRLQSLFLYAADHNTTVTFG